METDFLGQQYGPGDKILYSRGYGNSGSQIVLAEVVKVNPTTVTAKILKSSRGPGAGTTLTDSRTGKAIRYSKLHVKTPTHYKHKQTGKIIDSDEMYTRNPNFMRNPGATPYMHNRQDYDYVAETYWEYVTREPATVCFYIKDNIVKLPEGVTWPLDATQETATVNADISQGTSFPAKRDSTATTTLMDVIFNARPVGR